MNDIFGIILVESLNQLGFKGYTTEQWCDEIPYIVHCRVEIECGECIGQCRDLNHICYPNPGYKVHESSNLSKFICGDQSHEPKMNRSSMVSFSESVPLQTTGTTATWIAIIVIFILVGLLAWGLTRKGDI